MATLLLSAAGSAAGGAIGGTFLGVSAATIGQVAGAAAGAVIDSKLFRTGSRPVDVGRASSLRLQASTEGAPIAQVYGRMRVAGQVIWSTRYLESVSTTSQGGKGGIGGGSSSARTVNEYAYSISFAVALCEGAIERLGRIWADGKLLDTQGLTIRTYRGDPDQPPDPKIMAVEGADLAPAYRGTAYVVFEDLPLAQFGDRIPQLNFEVFRAPPEDAMPDGPEKGERPAKLVRGVALSPGSGEFALDTQAHRYVFAGGGATYANVNNAAGQPDALVALDQLEADLPDCDAVSLIVSWFGTDLRCGDCRIEPRVEENNRNSAPSSWAVSGLTNATANRVSLSDAGRPNYCGTPSDASIIRLIQELKARWKKVMMYPFILMDVPAGNGLFNPYDGTAGQAAFPWRGRITASIAPGQAGSPDQTPAITTEVGAFFGTVAATDFTVEAGGVTYAGPAEFTLRRFVLHCAALAAAAGGIDAICIGSEMRGLTTLRSDRTSYPAVDEFRALAAEVDTLLPGAQIGYAADWSEYFGHQPDDGSGDAIFHLDPLWADPVIDFVGIDDYTPLSDWRHETTHLDRQDGAASVYSLPYLNANIEGGEYYDYFYADELARSVQDRTPITDGAANEPWVFRPKDIRNWWSNPHHNRVAGVRDTNATGWVPGSKPVWLTETGCPAVDLGGNMPNLFYDPKSSESGLPYGSIGARDDEMQRRFLQAKLGYWQDGANNPVSPVYGGPMIPDDRVFVWTWDTRPFPDFPTRESVWSDGPLYDFGHWITGRVSASSLAEVVADICSRRGVAAFDVSGLYGTVDGYVIDQTQSAREAIQPLMQAYGFDAFEAEDRIVFRMRDLRAPTPVDDARAIASDDPVQGPVLRERTSAGEIVDAVRLSYVEAESDYRLGAAEARQGATIADRTSETSLPIALAGARARLIAQRWLAEGMRVAETAELTLPPSQLALEPGDLITIGTGTTPYRIDTVVDGEARSISAARVERSLYVPAAVQPDPTETLLPVVPGPIEAIFLDLPVLNAQSEAEAAFAVTAVPWPGDAAVYKAPQQSGFTLATQTRQPALIGTLADELPPGDPNRWQRVEVEVLLPGAGIASADRLSVLNGANVAALERPDGEWEVVQFQQAALVDQGRYRLGMLLRGQRGTGGLTREPLASGTRFVILNDTLATLDLAQAERGLQRFYRVGPAQFGVSHPSYVDVSATFRGTALRPFAPARISLSGQLGADIMIGWIRQTRIGGDNWEQVEVPLGEAQEAYRLRILSGGAVLRETTQSGPSFTYTAAMQVADEVSAGDEITVAQLSNAYGYGPEKRITIDG